ncbi:MAG: glucuronate isomerase, partial [Eubacteriales bacterium]
MKEFMDGNFLLKTETAKILYHHYAAKMPIIDYHCHVPPKEIAEDKRYANITELWLGGDHYKWRAMRSNGIDEKYITGDASDYEKFRAWAKTMPKLIGNPLYHWTHLELQRYFGYDGILNEETCDDVWALCNEILERPDMSARSIIRNSGVRLLCTTDDPIDDLRYHKQLAADDSYDVKVLPAFRPDKG